MLGEENLGVDGFDDGEGLVDDPDDFDGEEVLGVDGFELSDFFWAKTSCADKTARIKPIANNFDFIVDSFGSKFTTD